MKAKDLKSGDYLVSHIHGVGTVMEIIPNTHSVRVVVRFKHNDVRFAVCNPDEQFPPLGSYHHFDPVPVEKKEPEPEEEEQPGDVGCELPATPKKRGRPKLNA